MSYAPQGFYQWLSAVSVPVAGFAVRYAMGLSNRFIVLEALFKDKKASIEKMEAQQKEFEINQRLHSQVIEQVQSAITKISQQLEPLPRIATQLETLGPLIAKTVPREEFESRMANMQAAINNKV